MYFLGLPTVMLPSGRANIIICTNWECFVYLNASSSTQSVINYCPLVILLFLMKKTEGFSVCHPSFSFPEIKDDIYLCKQIELRSYQKDKCSSFIKGIQNINHVHFHSRKIIAFHLFLYPDRSIFRKSIKISILLYFEAAFNQNDVSSRSQYLTSST